MLVGAHHGARRPGIEDAGEVAVRLKVVSLCGELVCLVAVSDLSEMIEIHNMCQPVRLLSTALGNKVSHLHAPVCSGCVASDLGRHWRCIAVPYTLVKAYLHVR